MAVRRKTDPYKQPGKLYEIERICLRNSERIFKIADDLLMIAKSDVTKDKLFKIKELADTNVKLIDYPGFGS